MTGSNFADRFFADQKKLYERGDEDKWRLPFCIAWCIQNQVSMPLWVQQAFEKAYQDATNRDAKKKKSWDDVFGPPLPKGKQQKIARRNSLIAAPIWEAVQKLYAKGQPIDEAMFEKIAKMFVPEIKSGTVKAIYYEFKNSCDSLYGFKNGDVPKDFALELKISVVDEYSKAKKALLKSFQKD